MRLPLFKVFFLCVVLPPFLYIFSIQYLEKMFNRVCLEEIKDVYIGDSRLLFDGSVSVKDAVNQNITRYLREQWLVKMGLKLEVIVTTRKGTIIYPAIFEDPAAAVSPSDPMQIAAENYNLLNDGLVVHSDSEILYYKPISIVILFLYIGSSLVFMAVSSMRSFRKSKMEEMEKLGIINRLIEREKRSLEILKTLGKKRNELNIRYDEIKDELEKEKLQASKTEDGMLEEIISLEEELNRNVGMQQEQQQEIDRLKAEIERFEKNGRKGKQKNKKGVDSTGRRFKALYKNVVINKKALDGFVSLPEDMKIKCEEVIHQLNENPEQIHIKRKVFSKKSNETVLEILFAYKGRLYFRRLSDQRVEILTIGTKNTQLKDLEFIDSL
ncbi:MAG: hypothetical protein C4522_16070 [Desulfobacteraceae bacterium]|nr:MAG: hypothetical protein C4522_16070 [Desulfobacteraceae bacterium]